MFLEVIPTRREVVVLLTGRLTVEHSAVNRTALAVTDLPAFGINLHSEFVNKVRISMKRAFYIDCGQRSHSDFRQCGEWPRKKIKGWWISGWVCPWFGQAPDLLEPWLLVPFLFHNHLDDKLAARSEQREDSDCPDGGDEPVGSNHFHDLRRIGLVAEQARPVEHQAG